MAHRTIIQLTDDLDGTPIAEGKGETIRFAIDRKDYEIDLNSKNAKALRDTLSNYTRHARKASAPSATSGRRRAGRSADGSQGRGVDPKAVREWAASQGIEVSSRGRVSADLVAKFQESKR